MKEKPSLLQVWLIASRPHTLPASIAPVIVGSALTFSYSRSIDAISVSIASLSFWFGSFACLIQLGTNLHNDYSDFVKGADTEKRVGHARATQRGWLTPRQTAAGATLVLTAALIIGLYLSSSSMGITNGLPADVYMLFVTFSSVFNAFAYTGGQYPLGFIGLQNFSLGYLGLGDLFVFLYFGTVAVITVPYLLLRLHHETTLASDHDIFWTAPKLIFQEKLMLISFLISIPVGLLSTCIIVVNNLRDRETDVTAGKKTLAVRFGAHFARVEYGTLMTSSYLITIIFSHLYGPAFLLPLISVPLAYTQCKAVALGEKDGAALDEHVGGAAKVLLMYCLLLAVAIVVTSFRF